MQAKPVKIFTSSNITRLKYVADLLLKEILGLTFEIVTDKRKLGKSSVINYSSEKIYGSFRITPLNLLFETGIRSQEINVTEWKSLPVFFQSDDDSDLPFDIFAATFYIVTRYEEYSDFEPDEFGRYKSSASIASKNGFLNIPVVDFWAKEFARMLVRKFDSVTIRNNKFKALVSFDIDEPFAYLGKNIAGTTGAFLKDFVTRTDAAGHRLKCLLNNEKDPWEVFDYMTAMGNRFNSAMKFFIPVGDHSEYEKNPSWKNKDYRNLIDRIAGGYDAGIHPSLKASTEPEVLNLEIKRLKTIVRREISASRFHYVMLSMPWSYRNLINSGITEDYSMGYPDEPGFRAGISRPFKFFDLIEDEATDLVIFPFQVMDITFSHYKQLTTEASIGLIRNIISQTKKAGGVFISIWHNTTLLDSPECRGWREVFENTLKEQSEL